jgi:hypothetical protein
VNAVSKAFDINRCIASLEVSPSSLSNPNILIATYDQSQLAFITISFSYITFFLNLLQKPQLTLRTPDDIDPEYGLHDYTVKIELRSNKESFWYEIFQNVFTKKEFSEGYALFTLIDSQKNDRHYKFPGEITYP